MAQKRMFNKNITDADKFLDLPMESQTLYFHLALKADDDGFTPGPNKMLRVLGIGREYLGELVRGGYIYLFDSGVCLIRHWHIHNNLRKDRVCETIYQEEKGRVVLTGSKVYAMAEQASVPVAAPRSAEKAVAQKGVSVGISASGKEGLSDKKSVFDGMGMSNEEGMSDGVGKSVSGKEGMLDGVNVTVDKSASGKEGMSDGVGATVGKSASGKEGISGSMGMTVGKENVSPQKGVSGKCQADVRQMSAQGRIDKDRIDKGRRDKERPAGGSLPERRLKELLDDPKLGIPYKLTPKALAEYTRQMDYECIEYAFHEAKAAGKQSLGYVRAVLKRMLAEGITDKAKLKNRESSRHGPHRGADVNEGVYSHNYTQEDYDKILERLTDDE